MCTNRKSILDMTAVEAERFFMKPTSYVTLALPEYFDFQTILHDAAKKLDKAPLKDIAKINKLKECDSVNHTVLLNKDGSYDWRPIQIIHPLLYVNLVRCLTNSDSWEKIKERFKKFQKDDRIQCISIPVESTSSKSDTAEIILNWWEGLEQNSITQALYYSYCIKTDVTNCYGSIYTHTIAWAIHGKSEAKAKRNQNLLGNEIDLLIEQLQQGQINGIPQGGSLFDFVAEIVLGYADLQLSKRLTELGLKDWKILRYRDDYRIFAEEKGTAEQIIKELSDVLSDLNMHFNSKKTNITQDIIGSSIKADKRYWNTRVPIISTKIGFGDNEKIQYHLSFQKHLLEILWLSQQYPNSGSVKKALTAFAQRLDTENLPSQDTVPLISIVATIISNNPGAIPSGVAVLSRILEKSNERVEKISWIVAKIQDKIKNVPNRGFLEIWLQRLSILGHGNQNYSEKLCKTLSDPNISIWNSDWINGKYKIAPIISKEVVSKLELEVPQAVFDTFAEYDG